MGTKNSSVDTRDRAIQLAKEVGCTHYSVNIDKMVAAVEETFADMTGMKPKFSAHGGSFGENIALQNIQARLRMVFSYMQAQLLPWVEGGVGSLLVLSSGNVDEALRGYLTKYDCSSGDLNPIGAISKVDLKAFLHWGATNLGYPSLADVLRAPPTAELVPIESGEVQLDEVEMGMTYEELGIFGRLRKLHRCGPVSMFRSLVEEWKHTMSVEKVAEKVKHFFKYYSINRHKMTTITPSYHAENYSPDDNRFDLRQFLYNISWPWQFRAIDNLVEQFKQK